MTVVVPCYGEGRYLDDCLRTVSAQTYHDLQVIVIDDAGHDDSTAVAMSHASADSRIEIIRTHENVGLGAIRNMGTRLARGDLMLYLDGDDWIPEASVEWRVKALADHLAQRDADQSRRVAGVFGHWQHTPFDSGPGFPAQPCPRLTPIDLVSSRGANVFIVSAPLVRRDLMERSGGFAEGVPGAEDHLCWMRLLALDTYFTPCEQVVAFYRQKRTSMLRVSAETFAAFGIASRGWVDDAVASLPSDTSAGSTTRVRSGDLVMRWGRPRRSLTRMSAAGVVDSAPHERPTPPASADLPAQLPAKADGPLADGIAQAQRFLRGETPSITAPSATWFARTEGCLQAVGIDGDDPGALNSTRRRATASVRFDASTMAEGLEALAIGIQRVALGEVVELNLAPDAMAGALMGMALAPDQAQGLQFSVGPGDIESTRVAGPGAIDASDTGKTLSVDATSTTTPGTAFMHGAGDKTASEHVLAVASSGTGMLPEAWFASLGPADLQARFQLCTIESTTSRQLSDRAVDHRRCGLADLAAAALVVCQSTEHARFVAIANHNVVVASTELAADELGGIRVLRPNAAANMLMDAPNQADEH